MKKAMALILAAILAIGASGCGKTEQEKAPVVATTTATADKAVTTDTTVATDTTTVADTTTTTDETATESGGETTEAVETTGTVTGGNTDKPTITDKATKPTSKPTTTAATTKKPTKATTTTTKKPTTATTKAPVATKPQHVPNYTDPWQWPCDVKGMEADCKKYVESIGLHWDANLNVDKGSWAGNEMTMWGDHYFAPDFVNEKGEWISEDGVTTVFNCVKGIIDINRTTGSKDTYFKCVFIPDEDYEGHYDIYIVHAGSAIDPEWAAVRENSSHGELAKKAVN